MEQVRQSPLGALLNLLDELEQEKIWYRLEHVRNSITVVLVIPGQHWEVEFFEDGHVEVERFVSTGDIEERDIVDQLIARYRSEDRDGAQS
jgi:hypothetical protein